LPYLLKYQILVILYKIVTAGLIVLLLKKYTTIKQYIKYLSIFIIYTFILGGVVLGIIGLFKIDYSFNGVILYDFEFPISLFVIIFGSTIFLLKKMIIALKEQVQSSNFLCKVILIDGDNIIIDGDNYQLDLDPFDYVGHEQTCTFTFRNNGNVSTITKVIVTCDSDYFQMFFEPEFMLTPGEEMTFEINIVLSQASPKGIEAPINILFKTEDIYS
jgi:hypothetical protein